MSKQLFTNKNARRGNTIVAIPFHQLYQIVRDRLEFSPAFTGDTDAVSQNVCVEVEKAMGIFPNIDGVREDGTTVDLSPNQALVEELTQEAKLIEAAKVVAEGLNALERMALPLGIDITVLQWGPEGGFIPGKAELVLKRTTVDMEIHIRGIDK